ncbi:MAG: DUF3419 family protein, partial [Verrucomicrobiales bacterium]
MSSEIQTRADFSSVRYGQCWEDADVLAGALEPAGRRCVSIGSAGDNSFALLAAGAEQVTVVEMNPAQVACIELRRAAYRVLEYPEFLELAGVRESVRRGELFDRCAGLLADDARSYWLADDGWREEGMIQAGRFEAYFRMFRERVLPWVHTRGKVMKLLEERDRVEREMFYQGEWNSWRWRMMFKVFFSRFVMGRLGRDPEFFRYVEGSVAERILERVEHALVELEPAANPYLRWILTGTFGVDFPLALREEHYGVIRGALEQDRLSVVRGSLEDCLRDGGEKFDAFNLSDIFEYM